MKPSVSPARRVAGVLLAAHAAALLATSSAALQAPRNPQEYRNLLANAGFENPPVAAGASLDVASAGAWSASAGKLQLHNRVGSLVAYAGDQHLELESLSVVRQVCETRPGQAYSLGFAYRPRTEAALVAFEVWFAGSLLETVSVPAGSAASWVHRSYPVTGASTQDAFELRALTSSSVGVLVDECFLMPYDPSASEQLVRNGNFQEDPRLEPGASMSNPVFVGWFEPSNRTLEVKDLGTSANGASGKAVVDLDEQNAIAQRVFVVPDRPYKLSFSYSPNPSDDRSRSFEVRFAGQLLETVSVPSSSAVAWTRKTYTVTSETPLATIELRDRSGGYNGALIDAVTLTGTPPAPETAGQVQSHKIIAHTPTAGIRLVADAMFARGVASIGDLDGDGVRDIAVGSVGDDTGADNAGAVYVIFLRADRTARASKKIGEGLAGFSYDLDEMDGFGRALTGLGDLDGDGVPDIAVGANEDDSGSSNAGATYILFLNRDGTVKGQRKISATSGDPLQFVPRWGSEFGSSLAGMGDVDGDGIPDLAIGARFSNSVQVCFMKRDGSVRGSTNLTYGSNGFTDRATSSWDLLGMSCANMGDFDGDAVPDLLIGAYGREYAGQDFVGGQYLLLLNRNGTCKKWLYYGTENMNPRSQTLGLHYDLGTSCCGPGDVDGDGVRDILVGAQREGSVYGFDIEEGTKKGAAYLLLLNANGTIKTCQRLGDRAGGVQFRVDDGARWGESMCALGDHDGNGTVDVAIGSRFAFYTGGVFLCELRGEGEPPAPPLKADFVAGPVAGPAPLVVAFDERSTGNVASWSWDFGDGSTSSEREPSHAYAANGVYTVRLTVGDGLGGTHTKTATNLVTVADGDVLPAGMTRLGCGVNPAGSMRLLSGAPRVGTTLTLGVDNPFGTQSVGAIPRVLGSWTPAGAAPCGIPAAGQGMAAAGTPGELLVGAPVLWVRSGASWLGAGTPAPVSFPIPANAALLGRTMYVQGRLVDNKVGAQIPVGLADGFALTLQP